MLEPMVLRCLAQRENAPLPAARPHGQLSKHSAPCLGSGLSHHGQRGPHWLITGMGHHGRPSESPFSRVFAPQWPAETPPWWNTPGPSGRRRTGTRSILWCGTNAQRASSSATCPPSGASPAGTGRSLGSPAQTVSTAPPPPLAGHSVRSCHQVLLPAPGARQWLALSWGS